MLVRTKLYFTVGLNIHMLLESPLKIKIFPTNFAFIILPNCIRFQVCFVFPDLNESLVPIVTYNIFWKTLNNVFPSYSTDLTKLR